MIQVSEVIMVSDNMDKQQQQYLEGVELLTSSQPSEIYDGAISLDPSAYRVDEIIEAVGQERLIQHVFQAYSRNFDVYPMLNSILRHFAVVDLITAYRELSPESKNIYAAWAIMIIIDHIDPQFTWANQLVDTYSAFYHFAPKELNKSDHTYYWQICVEKLLSVAPGVARGAAEELAAHSAFIGDMLATVGETCFIQHALQCYGMDWQAKPALDFLLKPFSIPQLVNAYSGIDFEQLDIELQQVIRLIGGLFWLIEQKDPDFQWAYSSELPAYPLYDPKTSDRLNPWTGEFDPEED
jgi:hypothetical protein